METYKKIEVFQKLFKNKLGDLLIFFIFLISGLQRNKYPKIRTFSGMELFLLMVKQNLSVYLHKRNVFLDQNLAERCKWTITHKS